MAGSMFDPEYAASKAIPLSELTVSASGVRRLPIKDSLAQALREAVTAVYGPDYRVDVMSAAQPEGPKGTKGTTGTRRHGTGVAADIWVYSPDGKRLKGDELIPLGQHWLGTKQGSVGFPAKASSSMHLDFIGGTGPDAVRLGKGEGRVWYYGNPTKEQRSALAQSAGQGVLPKYAFEPEIVRKGLIPPGSIAAGKAPVPLDMPQNIRDKRTALAAINEVAPIERADYRGAMTAYAAEPKGSGLTSIPPRRPDSALVEQQSAPQEKPTQTATLPSGKVVEIGRIYTIGGEDFIGGTKDGVGTLTKAPASIINEGSGNSMVGGAVRKAVTDEVGKGIRGAVEAAPRVAETAVAGLSTLAGNVGNMFGNMFSSQDDVAAPTKPKTVKEAMQQLAAVKAGRSSGDSLAMQPGPLDATPRMPGAGPSATSDQARAANARMPVMDVPSSDLRERHLAGGRGSLLEDQSSALRTASLGQRGSNALAASATVDGKLGVRGDGSYAQTLMGSSFDAKADAKVGAEGRGFAALSFGRGSKAPTPLNKPASLVLATGPQVKKPKIGQSLDEMMDELDPDAPRIKFDEDYFASRPVSVGRSAAVGETEGRPRPARLRMADSTALPSRRPESRMQSPAVPARRPDTRYEASTASLDVSRPAALSAGRSGNALSAGSSGGRTAEAQSSRQASRAGGQLYQSAGYVFAAKEGGGYEQVGKIKDGKAVLYS